MNALMRWYDSRPPEGKLAIKVICVLGTALLSAVVNQKLGERRGYRKGYKTGHAEGHAAGYTEGFDKGMSPLKQAELDKAHMDGWKMGCSDGVRYSKPTVINTISERDAFSDGFDFELGRSLVRA